MKMYKCLYVCSFFCVALTVTSAGQSEVDSARTYDYNRLIGHWVGAVEDGDKSPSIYITVKPIDDTLRAIVNFPITNFYNFQGTVGARNDSSARLGPFRFTPNENTDELNGITRVGRNWQFPTRLRRGDPDKAPSSGTPPEPKRTGRPLWTFQTGVAIWGSPVLAGNLLYVASVDSTIYCINASAGEVIWRVQTDGPLVSYLTVVAVRLYALSDDGLLYVLDAETGKNVWAFDTGGGTVVRAWPDDHRFDHAGSRATVDGDGVLIGSAEGHVYSLDRETGIEHWRFKTEGIVRSRPVVSDGVVVFGSYDGYVYGIKRVDGSLLWKQRIRSPVISSAAVHSGLAIVGARDATLHAFELKTGESVWRHNYWASWVESTPIVFQDTLFIGSSDYQRALALDPKSGKEIWNFHTWGRPFGTPAPSGDYLFVSVLGNWQREAIPRLGKFYCLDRSTGAEIWRYDFEPVEG